MGTGRMLRNKKFSTAGVLLATLVVFGILATFHEFHGRSYHFLMAASPGLNGPEIQLLENEDRAYGKSPGTQHRASCTCARNIIIRAEQSPLFNDPMLRQFFGNMLPQIPREQRQHALGTGVIFDPNGYIVTNNHVIEHDLDAAGAIGSRM